MKTDDAFCETFRVTANRDTQGSALSVLWNDSSPGRGPDRHGRPDNKRLKHRDFTPHPLNRLYDCGESNLHLVESQVSHGGERIRSERQVEVFPIENVVIRLLDIRAPEIRSGERLARRNCHLEQRSRNFTIGYRPGRLAEWLDVPIFSVWTGERDSVEVHCGRTGIDDENFNVYGSPGDRNRKCGCQARFKRISLGSRERRHYGLHGNPERLKNGTVKLGLLHTQFESDVVFGLVRQAAGLNARHQLICRFKALRQGGRNPLRTCCSKLMTRLFNAAADLCQTGFQESIILIAWHEAGDSQKRGVDAFKE